MAKQKPTTSRSTTIYNGERTLANSNGNFSVSVKGKKVAPTKADSSTFNQGAAYLNKKGGVLGKPVPVLKPKKK